MKTNFKKINVLPKINKTISGKSGPKKMIKKSVIFHKIVLDPEIKKSRVFKKNKKKLLAWKSFEKLSHFLPENPLENMPKNVRCFTR